MNEVLYSSKSCEWETPQELFDKWDNIYHFTLDPCATKDNAKCEKFHTIEDDGLSQSWKDEIVFMNPPYGRKISKWIAKAYDESLVNNAIVVCLIPSRTDTTWWHKYVMKGNITFLKGRLCFKQKGEGGRAPFPSAIVIFNYEH